MKYKDLIQFDPITSVVKLVKSNQKDIAENLVRTFVFSKKIKEDVQNFIIHNLMIDPKHETKGIQIVGSYGTGKSHLMALISSIAEDDEYLKFIDDPDLKKGFKNIAGAYNVLRFEIGTDKPLKDIIFSQIERYLSQLEVSFSFDEASNFSWKEQIQQMMAAYEEKFPNKHLLIVIDELLEYLKGRKPTELHNDLMLLRQLGEVSDNSRFKTMFGVQELLYRSPEFQFQAEMLNKIEDRYDDLIITKEDVSFVVKERLLKKDLHQKNQIREHLLKYAVLFEGINTNLNEYVDLFPVHPYYIKYFSLIKHGKSQREILKVLSARFEELLECDLPNDSPGLITYDTYWKELADNPSIDTTGDIRIVKDKLEIIADRINGHFVGARANRKNLAISISNALAIRILCDDLDKRNGATAHSLKEDICPTIKGVENPELLLDAVQNTAKQLLTATAGQYVDQDNVSGEFYIRTEGGINVPQLIRDYADEVIKKDQDQADQYYYDFLQYVLGLQQNTYRTGFKIWQDSLEWMDKKSFRLGYIFFGNPNERSTTEPIQQYYIFFCPIFNKISRNDEADEVYFDMFDLSDDFKDTICLYGAAKAKESSAPSSQKTLFKNQIDEYLKKGINLFDKEFVGKSRVIYKGSPKPLKSYSLLGEGATKDMIFRDVASRVLNAHFNDKFPEYPAFNELKQPLTKENFIARVKNALKRIAIPNSPNRDGEAILSGLGLWNGQNIDAQHSKYADSIKKKLKDKGTGKVLNREEIIWLHYAPDNLWYSCDYNIDHQFEFIILAALAFKGDIEISWSGSKSLNATNIESLTELPEDDYFTFMNVKAPQGLPTKNLKALFNVLGLPDLTSELEKPDTITRIITEASTRVDRVVKKKAAVASGIACRTINLLDGDKSSEIKTGLENLATVLDGIMTYTSYGKLKSFKFTEDELTNAFSAYSFCDFIDKLLERAAKFEKLINYLYSAQSYVVESEKPLYDDMSAAIADLPRVMNSNNDTEIKKYEALINSLKDKYADYYIQQYVKCRLSSADARSKDRILNSETKKICDIIKDADFITPTEYEKWIMSIASLREADPTMNKPKVLHEPYHDFNPREFYGKPNYKIQDLEDLLEKLLADWTNVMRALFKDPGVNDNLELLDDKDRKLIVGFRDSKTEISLSNANKLRTLLSQLTQGIERVEISLDDLRIKLNKPFTPEEAIETLTKYINGLCASKDRNKIRIIIK